MPGYDRSRIVGFPEEELEEFTCGICLQIFIKPMSTDCCGQTFCFDCITEWLGQNNTCPIDRKPLTTSQLKSSPKIVNNLLNNMKIKCDFHENGCRVVIKINDLEKHTNIECEFNPFRNCEKCGLSQLNHSDQDCIKCLVEKLSKLQLEFNLFKEKGSSKDYAGIHKGVDCDGCQMINIRGVRYKCSVCHDFDLCENCESNPRIHNSNHEMIKIKTPRKLGLPVTDVYNRDGDKVWKGVNGTGGDTGIRSSKLYYCGKSKNECRCSRCDGRCGPTNGCPCNSCLQLISNGEGDKVWKGIRGTGGDTGRTPNKLFYCGKKKNQCRCGRCDGRCGPFNGCPCNSCLDLFN